MEFPRISKNKQGRKSVKVLNGGFNYCRLNDNSLSDAENMWYVEGKLRTRPGVKVLADTYIDSTGKSMVMTSGGTTDISTSSGLQRRLGRIYGRMSDGNTVFDAVMAVLDYEGGERESIILSGMSQAECAGIMIVESGGGGWNPATPDGAVAFIGQGGCSSVGRILAEPSDLEDEWVDITSLAYVPLVMINGQGSYTTENARSPGGVYEGINLLTPKFRARFTTTGENGRYFFLPYKQLDNTDIIVNYTEEDGTIYSYTIPAGSNSSPDDEWGISVHVSRTGGYIYCVQSDISAVRWFSASGINNNLEVVASKTRSVGRDIICSMRICSWFGSDRIGENGGARLFVSGHPKNPNLVHWSEVNNPLYFPENNFAYIGDAGQAVTAFAKQGERLIIFKEREMYCAAYASGSRAPRYNYDGSVIDATANAARFPVAQLHPFIGCDCPSTIRLCDNRLVWMGNGRIFALAAENQYSQNDVRTISAPIADMLAIYSQAELKLACSADYKGHYLLMLGNEIFLFDYCNPDYTAFLQNAANSNMQSRIPWMRWRIDCGIIPLFMMSSRDEMVIRGSCECGAKTGTAGAVFCGVQDEVLVSEGGILTAKTVPVDFIIRTGLFDFDRPERLKDIFRLYLELEGDVSSYVEVAYTDEYGDISGGVPIERSFDGELLRLAPNAVGVRQFGLMLQGRGPISIGGLTIYYRTYGKGLG
ncbi:MAG: hypothetical protein PHH84_07625 [Oscillospiraceae bacterium]|nr:hypothetical protein [Oscillospiraceae bacterium]MDD4414065.1 hypothetical protein [Oscillospiraceae bacterium]